MCAPEVGTIKRGSQEFLEIAVGSHIMIHEQRAALAAVDKARLECRSTSCEIGRKNYVGLSIGNPSLNLSDYDRTWLSGMRIGQD